ncbi:putative glycosyl transferase, family 1 [Rosa chinensis]|uniref:Putative glycosyl transferase, family 1 n=1 Tax=Rosa chinensis TaxID=74649 RepID=A0A2P6SCP4_ROSCH|nr:uncharacterized protein LOC112192611 [Rosa chinensis]PRQ56452.1 putative glycosyl transferase, family 1 [Rosa chinensis]
MGRNSSAPPPILDDNGGAGGNDLGFHSIRDRFPFKRNPNPSHHRGRDRSLVDRGLSSLRHRPHHRFYRKGGKSAFYSVLIFVLFGFAAATMLLQSSMTSVFRQGSERGRLLRDGLKFGSTLRFVPGRVSQKFVQADGLDGARNEPRIGVRPPRLALILGNMKKDPHSLMLITVMKNIKKLGYRLKIFSTANGKARKMWEEHGGPISVLAPEKYSLIDWSIFEGLIVDSLEAKELISSLMQEPFCSVPLIWIIQEDTLAKRLPSYAEMGWTHLVSHWKSVLSRANVVVFPDFTLPMLYSVLDTGNFYVIPGSPVDVWAAESYSKTHSKNQLRKNNRFSEDDMLVLVVGSSFFFNELSWDYAVAMHSIGPLLIEYARRKDAEGLFKFVFLFGNSSDGYDDAFQEVASRLGLLQGSVRHYGLNDDVNSVLLMADIVLYGSSQDVQGFPPLLIRAMTFGIPVIAPDFPVLKKYLVDGVHTVFFPRHDPDALLKAFSQMISNGKLSKFARTVASSGRLIAMNLLASESITGYARLLESVLNFPSDALLPGPFSQLQQGTWEWNLFGSEIDYGTGNINENQASVENSSVIHSLEQEFSGFSYSTNTSENGTENLARDNPTQLDWDVLREIELSEEYERLEMEELAERMESDPGQWDDIYRNARKAEKLKFEANERDEGELERTGQPVCIYEIYIGSGSWPFLHHGSLYRGLSLSTKARRSKSDDVNAVDRLPVLNETYYRNVLCEIGGMFAIANKVDNIHKRPWIGFQSWRAAGRKVSLSKKAERVLEQAIQDNTKGDVIYFWSRLNRNGGVTGSKDALTFWSACDILNEGHCRNIFEDAFRLMYVLPSNAEALPPMPEDGGHWSALHSWVMPTRSFLEFAMFSRMFVDSLDALHTNSTKRNFCLLGSSEPEQRHCYCRVLELLVNVWAYHSARTMVFIDPLSGSLEEQHPVEQRKGFMWAKYFNSTLLKSMDEDLAEAADDGDHPREMWLWPLTGEVHWQGIYEREREERYRLKMDKKRKTKEKLFERMKYGYKQKTLGG